MAAARAPKQWSLTKNETVRSFEVWRQTLLYSLALDANFSEFLKPDNTWQKQNKANLLRGFADDTDDIPAASRRTAVQKNASLELMLGQIANFCPVVSRNTIVKSSTSLNDIWQSIRMHFGFHTTGSHLLDFAHMKLEPDERPEDLFQRIMSFFEDNLAHAQGTITHHGETATEDEELSPTFESFIVLQWLRLIHEDLPQLVKQRYGTELRTRTLASIKPEISMALGSLLDELHSMEEVKIARSTFRSYKKDQATSKSKQKQQLARKRKCALCEQTGRSPDNHYLSRCPYLPEADQRFFARTRSLAVTEEDYMHSVPADTDAKEDVADEVRACVPKPPIPSLVFSRRVDVFQCPCIDMFCNDRHVRVVLDTGAETNMIRSSLAASLGAKINKCYQRGRW